MARRLEYGFYGTALYDPPRIHDHDIIAQARGYSEIVCYDNERQPSGVSNVGQKIKELCLRGRIKRGCWLVRDKEFGIAGNRYRPDDTLQHAAAHLVGILLQSRFRGWNADSFQEGDLTLSEGLALETHMQLQGFGELIADSEDRVQRDHRVLHDHADPLPAKRPHLCLGLPDDVVAVEGNSSRLDLRRTGEELHDRHRGRGFSATGFADDS